jgi:predicted alpha/beta-fold hydrolase
VSARTFTPAWWARNPHLQTLWRRLFPQRLDLEWRMERWDTPDGDFLDIARVDPPTPAAPRLLLLHGLEGGMHSHYAGATLAEARRRGWGADMLLFRSCGPELNRARRFYHSGETGDLAFVVRRLTSEAPDAPLLLAGYSLGGNVLLKWLGEPDAEIPPQLRAAAAVSVPFDLARGSRQLARGFSRVYERYFLRSLKAKTIAKLMHYPDLADRVRLDAVRRLFDFDDLVTAPLYGFADAADYYHRSSAIRWLAGVRVPTLLLNALDDPFLPREVLDEVREAAAANPALHVEFPRHGGHVGFVAGRVPWRPFFYADWRIADFLAQHLDGEDGMTI